MYGLYLEGCKWEFDKNLLAESEPKILYSEGPIIWLKPVIIGEENQNKIYRCPVYKTSERKGTLSTTGHSTNFITNINMPSEESEDHWVKRGVAMLC
jgi:dynein heavy chain